MVGCATSSCASTIWLVCSFGLFYWLRPCPLCHGPGQRDWMRGGMVGYGGRFQGFCMSELLVGNEYTAPESCFAFTLPDRCPLTAVWNWKRNMKTLNSAARRVARHAVLHDQESEATYTPLQHISKDQGTFVISNSSLSEFGV